MNPQNHAELNRRHAVKGVLTLLLLCVHCSLATSQSYENAPFDLARSTLPPGYYGYDPEAFVKGYQEAVANEQRARRKDEFETTAEYQKRLKELEAQNPFVSKTYAFAAVPSRVSYEADTQTFSLNFKPDPAPQNNLYHSVLLKHGARDMGSYTAQNAFGAMFTVTKSLFSSFELWLPTTEGPTDCGVSVTVPAPEAKAMKPNVSALVVVRPVKPYASSDSSFKRATFSEPHENISERGAIYGRVVKVIFYDRYGGRILGSCP